MNMQNGPYIIVPPKRLIQAEPIMSGCGVAGYFRMVLKERDGTVVRDTGWMKNLITNSGMIYIRDDANYASRIELGSGNTAPAFTDTGVTTSIDGIKNTLSGDVKGYGGGNTYVYTRAKATFLAGQSTGPIREMAVHKFAAGGAGNCFSHAILVDSGGSPTEIVKGADQQLDVYYEVRNYPKLTDTTGTIDISGVSYDYTVRAKEWTQTFSGLPIWEAPTGAREVLNNSPASGEYLAFTGGDLGATTSNGPTGTNLGSLFGDTGAAVTQVTASGTYYNDGQLQVGIDYWNHANGIRCVTYVGGNTSWQIKYAQTTGGAAIPKTDEDRLRLNWRLQFDRV